MAVRRSLWWMLGAAGALSVIALAAFPPAPRVVDASRRDLAPAATGWGRSVLAARPSPVALAALPAHLDREPLTIAERDPFSSPPPTPLPAARTVRETPTLLTKSATEPVAPQPPALTHRFIGSMRTPEGQALVYITDGSNPVLAQPGTALASGYVVEFVDEHQVRLVYPPLAHQAVVTIPPAPTP